MDKNALYIVNILNKNGYIAYFAGGCVRDMIMKRESDDVDIATSATPEEVMRLFDKTISVGAQFGVVVVVLDGKNYEVATFRTDKGYHDGRHPVSVEFKGPEEDARLRSHPRR